MGSVTGTVAMGSVMTEKVSVMVVVDSTMAMVSLATVVVGLIVLVDS